jgi:hypothetical protein
LKDGLSSLHLLTDDRCLACFFFRCFVESTGAHCQEAQVLLYNFVFHFVLATTLLDFPIFPGVLLILADDSC